MKKAHQLRSVFVRELASYFNSPIAYIFIVVFVIVINGLFMTNFFLAGQADMRYFFDLLPLMLCAFIPALTMRLWAEDKKGNTFELLLTFPMSSTRVVFGKFLAGLVFYLISLMGTLFIPVMLACVSKPDFGPIFGGYLGALFLGAFFISIGLFVSGLCVDQIVAFIIAMLGCFFFYIIGWEGVSSTMDGWIPGFGSFLVNAFGATRHFMGFGKGVVDVRDVLYFVLMIGIFLSLNAISVEDRLKRRAKLFFTLTAVVGFIVAACANVLLSDMPLGRFDLTEGRIYTVTEAAEKILQKLDAPVTLKFYVTPQDKMPTAMKTLEQDVKDRLEELKLKSKGKLTYKTIHMEAAPDQGQENNDSLQSKLQRKGISPISVRSIDKDEMGVKLVYTAIALAYKDRDEEYIPRVLPTELQKLEYQVSAKIYRMLLNKKPMVALMAPYKEKAMDPKFLDFLKQIGQGIPLDMREDKFRVLEAGLQYEDYKSKRIKLTKEEPIPEGADAVIVVAPEKLSPRQRYELNRYLYQGGNVILAAQNFNYDYRQSQFGTSIYPQKIQAQVNDLLSPYGVSLDDNMLMDENHTVINISSSVNFGPMAVTTPVKVPMQIMVDPGQMNKDVSVTAGLGTILYLWGSALRVEDDKIKNLGLKKTILLSSGQTSWLVPSNGGMLTKDDVSSYGKKMTGPFPLAVTLEGQFPDASKDAPVPAWEAEDGVNNAPGEQLPSLKSESAKPGKLIVIGCSKMFEEELMKDTGSMNFFTNAVDALTLGGDLTRIRDHQAIARRVNLLSTVEKLWYRFLTIFLVPIVFIALGLARVMWRKKEKKDYLTFVKDQARA